MKGIIPANIIDWPGVLTDYMPEGQVRTNMAHIGVKYVPARFDSILSLDVLTYDLYSGDCRNIECFDLRVVTLTNRATDEIQGAQMWVQSGNKNAALQFTQIEPIVWGGVPAAYIQWNASFIRFAVDCKGPGIPHTFHEFYDQPYSVNAWFTQVGAPQFWQAVHEVPVMVENPHWVGATPSMCATYTEAYWAQNAWQYGQGGFEIKPNGQRLPIGFQDVTRGSSETRAKGITPLWSAKIYPPSSAQWEEYAMWKE